ncbi:hypothetical protein ATCV1_z808L [Acanthocystis turfacea chlorella virus 1]|uniref:Uncharacterized protein z808L n=1 Tax=Chlorovirus heliozoae TaxID=322019 RepID=A7KA68_9PHYC|nr:hypothetical protein ATCV1_z808L [Acanthocystis turfacea chlorella virus 1]ABT16942.1 hypothetical protein ATCV1_z808L [Acanthocystis turfacea chlorella virus 1]
MLLQHMFDISFGEVWVSPSRKKTLFRGNARAIAIYMYRPAFQDEPFRSVYTGVGNGAHTTCNFAVLVPTGVATVVVTTPCIEVP